MSKNLQEKLDAIVKRTGKKPWEVGAAASTYPLLKPKKYGLSSDPYGPIPHSAKRGVSPKPAIEQKRIMDRLMRGEYIR
jgi:hypothetical protein